MGGTSKLYIKSDFKDYYDIAGADKPENKVEYIRLMSDVPGKVAELKKIHKLGNQTIKIEPINRISTDVKKVIVYNDIKGHRGNGKALMSLSDANMLYPNKLGTEYFESNSGITYKILTVGKRRFRCILKNVDYLTEKEVISIDELSEGYNYQIALPIYSLDYVKNHSNQMVIADFNTVQRLDYLGMEKYMTPQDVVDEIYRALIAYNKI